MYTSLLNALTWLNHVPTGYFVIGWKIVKWVATGLGVNEYIGSRWGTCKHIVMRERSLIAYRMGQYITAEEKIKELRDRLAAQGNSDIPSIENKIVPVDGMTQLSPPKDLV